MAPPTTRSLDTSLSDQQIRTYSHLCMQELIDRGDAAAGVDTRQLQPGDTLVMRTRNTSYTVRLVNPARSVGTGTSDGKYMKSESDVHLLGATLSGRGTMVKLGWILLGFRMVLLVPGRELVTTPVQSLAVNGTPLVPAAGLH